MFSWSTASFSPGRHLATSKALGKKQKRFFAASPKITRSLASERFGLVNTRRGVGLVVKVTVPLLREIDLELESWEVVAMLGALLFETNTPSEDSSVVAMLGLPLPIVETFSPSEDSSVVAMLELLSSETSILSEGRFSTD